MIESYGNNINSNKFYLSTLRKIKNASLCEDHDRAYDISDKLDNKINRHTDDENLLNSFLCRNIRKIDLDLKNLHERWSNID